MTGRTVVIGGGAAIRTVGMSQKGPTFLSVI